MLEACRSLVRFSSDAACTPPRPISRKNAVPMNSRNAAARSSERLSNSPDNSIFEESWQIRRCALLNQAVVEVILKGK